MLTIGITCPPFSGHLDPMLALGGELQRRGHRVIVLNIADVEAQVQKHGLTFAQIGQSDHAPEVLRSWLTELENAGRLGATRLAIRVLHGLARALLRDAPDIVTSFQLDGMIVDQVEYAGATLADGHRLPYVTVAGALPVNRERGVPSVFTGWHPRSDIVGQVRDRALYAMSDLMMRSVMKSVNEARAKYGLASYAISTDHFSPLAQISQCPEAFDFERFALPAVWHGVGTIRPQHETFPSFPWERLDGRPLAYATLGSIQGGKRKVFAAIAEACAPLGVQLVISHGYRLGPTEVEGFAGDPLVLPYVPQRALLERASLIVTHAGLNTVLDSLVAGVPSVAIPIAFEQQAIAARLAWHKAGEVVPWGAASVHGIRRAAKRVLSNPSYKEAARRVGGLIARCGGVKRAADVVEMALTTRAPVLTSMPARATERKLNVTAS